MLGVQGSFWVTLYSLYLNGEQEPQTTSFLGLPSLDHGLGYHGGVTNQSTMSPDTKTTVTTAEYPYLYLARQPPASMIFISGPPHIRPYLNGQHQSDEVHHHLLIGQLNADECQQAIECLIVLLDVRLLLTA